MNQMAVMVGGGFIGSVSNAGTVIDNCYCTGNVGVSGSYRPSIRAGGFIGTFSAGTIKRCYSSGNVECQTQQGGGFCGLLSGGDIVDSYSAGAYLSASTLNSGNFVGYYTAGTYVNCGCYDYNTGISAIGTPADDIDYEKADPTEWYDATEGVYDDGANVWDFATPVWYEWSTDYPKFEEEPSDNAVNAIFFGCHF